MVIKGDSAADSVKTLAEPKSYLLRVADSN
jgi:hypothetical protein